jgi:hypothetical protein
MTRFVATDMGNSAVEGLAKLGIDLGSLKATSVEETTDSITGLVRDSFASWLCEFFLLMYAAGQQCYSRKHAWQVPRSGWQGAALVNRWSGSG